MFACYYIGVTGLATS